MTRLRRAEHQFDRAVEALRRGQESLRGVEATAQPGGGLLADQGLFVAVVDAIENVSRIRDELRAVLPPARDAQGGGEPQ